MALKALMLKKKLDEKRAELRQAEEKAASFVTREADLEKAIEEAETAEERSVVEENIESFETEKADAEKTVADLTAEVTRMEEELAAEEAKQDTVPEQSEPVVEENRSNSKEKIMEVRSFRSMNFEERTAFVQREEVKSWIDNLRKIGKTRSVTGGDNTIPTVMLPLIRESIERHSKLLKHVNYKPVKGKSRQNIISKAPEAIWTEMTSAINELTVAFGTPVELDGYKVAGYVPVPNSLLDDSDVALATEVIEALGEAIGYALDKAIVAGAGSTSHMPKGFAVAACTGTDQKTTIAANDSVGTKLFQKIILALAKANHERGEVFWVMNKKTRLTLLAESVGVNAAASIVAGMGAFQMPVIGGAIEELDFIPDNMIFAGYGECYLLAEREGTAIDLSKEVQFIEDNTVYRGKARYDGKPVFTDAFVAIGISATTPAISSITFATAASSDEG